MWPVMLYNVGVVFGTGYAVFVLGYSGWWFLLAVGLMYGGREK